MLLAGLLAGCAGGGGPAPTGSVAAAALAGQVEGVATADLVLAADPTPTPSAATTPAPTPNPIEVPLVPVTGFWSTKRTISRTQLAAAVAGSGSNPGPVYVSAADLAPLGAALGVKPGKNVHAVAPGKVAAAIARAPDALGFLRAEDVTPDVRALAIGKVALFGETRTSNLALWPLLVNEPPGSAPSTFDPAAAWTLAAGGDVMLDREVYRLAVLGRKGADYPWNGGTATITARVCCGYPGFAIVRGRSTGHAGALRALLRGADVTLVNLEGPAPNRFTYHPRGLVFSMDPKLLVGLARAGIDVVTLANNHIRNAGSRGVTDTERNLDRYGIAHAGAAANLAAARRPAWLEAGGQKIAFLGYNAAGGGAATAGSPGAAPLSLAAARADIRAARRAGADLVIVVPHWGTEYTDAVAPAVRRLGASLVAAGADMVLGSHSHWAGPLQFVDGHLVVYSLGDFVFDLSHDTRTQEGVLVEATFVGRRLAQVELHPTLILASSQPNLLDPSKGGNALLRAIEAASRRLTR
jgi:poly-gamma-glutamate capsule biosynthesis protein CapA/YwtB (metallophosphatase superfamily)